MKEIFKAYEELRSNKQFLGSLSFKDKIWFKINFIINDILKSIENKLK